MQDDVDCSQNDPTVRCNINFSGRGPRQNAASSGFIIRVRRARSLGSQTIGCVGPKLVAMDVLNLGGAGVRVIDPSAARIVIGRSRTCDVVLANDPAVSRRHALVERFDSFLRVRDLGSSNGTFLNGVKVGGPQRLKPGDAIAIGGTTIQYAVVDDVGLDHLTTQAAAATEYGLSPREVELLRLLARGLTDQEVADHLTISVSTVRSHLDRIRDKTGRRRRTQLVNLAAAMGLND